MTSSGSTASGSGFLGLREFVATIREVVAAEEFETWGPVAAGLEGWPGWASSSTSDTV